MELLPEIMLSHSNLDDSVKLITSEDCHLLKLRSEDYTRLRSTKRNGG